MRGTSTGVASHTTALAPFSQNSAVLRLSGSGQAQLMQSNPPFWLSDSMSLAVRAAPSCSSAGPIECRTPGTPAAQSFGSPTVISASVTSSFGGCSVTVRSRSLEGLVLVR